MGFGRGAACVRAECLQGIESVPVQEVCRGAGGGSSSTKHYMIIIIIIIIIITIINITKLFIIVGIWNKISL